MGDKDEKDQRKSSLVVKNSKSIKRAVEREWKDILGMVMFKYHTILITTTMTPCES